MAAQIEVVLKWKEDQEGGKYLLGELDLPASMDLSNLIIFVWPNSPESDEVPMLRIRKREEKRERDKPRDNRDQRTK
jgi:hypothetical protein